MRLEFDDESLLEAEEAVAHYSAIAPKIGDTFVLALRWGLARRHESGPAD